MMKLLLLNSFLFLFFLSQFQCDDGGDDLENFQKTSIIFAMEKLFLEIYSNWNNPSSADVSKGAEIYKSLVSDPNSEVMGKNGAILDHPIEKLKEVVAIWRRQDLISSEDEAFIVELLLEGNFYFKTLRESIHVRSNGDLVYAYLGFLKTSPGKATIFYNFLKYSFKEPIPTPGHSEDKDNCVMWGIICETYFSSENVEEFDFLAKYMRSDALKKFRNEADPYKIFIEREAERYRRFMPQEISEKLNRIYEEGNKRPDEILDSDPINGNDENVGDYLKV